MKPREDPAVMKAEHKRVLILLDYHVEPEEIAERLTADYPGAAFTTIMDKGRSPSFLKNFPAERILYYHISLPLAEKIKLMLRVRREKFSSALFAGRTADLRQMAVAYASGASEKKFWKLSGNGEISIKKINLPSLFGMAFWRSLIFFIFLPFLIILRLIFKIGERGYFLPRRPPPSGAKLPNVSSRPPISVVIPNYDGLEMLKKCLPSVVESVNRYNPQSEIIVVDDGSSDESVAFIRERFPRITVLALEKNRGFGRACHTGIKKARYELLLLLNNDIAVPEGFIEPLIEHFTDGGVFAVQPKAYGWDRKTFNFGLNMGKFEAGYIRIWNEIYEGDKKRVYRSCSTLYALGGAMLFDREKYFFLEGFDPLFYPFRWEDIDLGYRALKRGWKVIYEPESIVYHRLHGTLEKVFQADYLNIIEQKNELLFIWKNIQDRQWTRQHFQKLPRLLLSHLISGRFNFARALFRAILQLPEARKRRKTEKEQCLRPDCQVLEKSLRFYRKFGRRGFRHRPGTRKQILLLNPVFPFPPIDGGKTRLYNTIREISRRHDIHLLCYIEPSQKKYLPEMEKICRKIDAIDWPASPGYLGRLTEALFPLYYRSYYSDQMRNRLWKILDKRDIDLIQCEFDKTMFYVNFIHGYPTLYIEHDVSSLFLRGGKNPPFRGWKRVLDLLEWLKSILWEVQTGRKFTKIVALSEEDRKVVKSILPEKDVDFVKHGTHVEHFTCDYRQTTEKSLIFVGSYIHYPNREAILSFYKKIWPLVVRKHPDARLKVVGSHPDGEIAELGKEPGIEVTGFVEDVREHIRKAMIFIAPMNKGRGMKGKILEAMVMAKPVVTTSIGIQGAEVRPGEHLLVADKPAAFAECIDRLFNDPELRKKLACRGQELVRKEYDWSRAAEQMDEIYDQLI